MDLTTSPAVAAPPRETGVPRVSVLIANYNGARFLAEAVRSALAQSVADIEVLIADDLSTDDSPAIARDLARDDPRVRFLPATANLGPGGARNRALDVARGDWIAILDNDDRMRPERLERLLAAADAHGADIVADDLLLFHADGSAPPQRFLEPPETSGAFALTARRYFEQTAMYGAKPNLGFLKPMIRRAAMRAADVRYDERLRIAEDDDLVVRLLAAGLRYWVLPEPLYEYRKHSASISHRTSVADLMAIVAAAERTRAFFAGADPATRRALDRRLRAVRDALAFQHFLDAAAARRLPAAAAALARRPRAIRLLRLPLAPRVARLRARLARIGRRRAQ